MKVYTVDTFGGTLIAAKQNKKIIAITSGVNTRITLETNCINENLLPPDRFFDYNRDELIISKNYRNEVSADFKKNSGPNSINCSYSLSTRKLSENCIHLSFTILFKVRRSQNK